jgi:hypothetical protein
LSRIVEEGALRSINDREIRAHRRAIRCADNFVRPISRKCKQSITWVEKNNNNKLDNYEGTAVSRCRREKSGQRRTNIKHSTTIGRLCISYITYPPNGGQVGLDSKHRFVVTIRVVQSVDNRTSSVSGNGTILPGIDITTSKVDEVDLLTDAVDTEKDTIICCFVLWC